MGMFGRSICHGAVTEPYPIVGVSIRSGQNVDVDVERSKSLSSRVPGRIAYNRDESSPGSPPVPPPPYASQGSAEQYQIAILRTRGITGGKSRPVNLVQKVRLVLRPRPGGSSKPATEIRSANGIPYPAPGDHTPPREMRGSGRRSLASKMTRSNPWPLPVLAPSAQGPSPDTSGGDAVMGFLKRDGWEK
ncbi:hypothetical protein VTN02DRAFT_353 [Thermoascus thermophilus]